MTHNRSDLFSWFDYILFTGMLIISMAIGIYFGFFGKKQRTADEYLKGSKQMTVVPIAISLIANQISSTTLLAVPADIYRFGSNYVWIGLATIIECIITYYVYLPVFFNLQVTSVYEYIEMRFDRRLRFLTSLLGILAVFVFCPIVVYIPSLAFSQVTGFNVRLIACITSVICIFYTSIGGLKAVVWTDTVQFLIMITTFLIILFLGVSKIGGFKFMWSKSVEGGRLDIIDFSFDPTLRDSFGALIIGGTIQWLSCTAVYQGSVQKFMSVPSYKEVKQVMPFYAMGMVLFHMFATFTGLLLYARFWNCDPLSTQKVSRLEQLVPYLVMEIAGEFPGLPGIFIAGVYSAGLSSLSASLNTLSAIIYEVFVAPFIPQNTSQSCISTILKFIVLIIGVISTILVLVFEKLEGIFAVYTALIALSFGPLLGLFTLGMLIPKANSTGAFVGASISSIVVSWIAVQNQRYQSVIVANFIKPTSTDGCNVTIATINLVNQAQVDSPFILYRISFWFYSCICLCMTVIIGVIISTTTLLAVPADVYRFGSNYIWLALATIIECIITYYVYLPVFFNLQITSIYEYIQLRFDKRLRLLTSLFGILSIFIVCPVVIYIPSLAFSQVTGVNVYLIAGITSIICIFYTTIGGLKAVVWTDTVQFFIMIVTFIIILCMGIVTIGGFEFMWSKSVEGHRLDITDFSFNPTLRDSFGALIIGGTVQWLSFTAACQGTVQKLLSVPTYKEVRKVMPLFAIGMALFHIFATFAGLLLYARFWNCDPLSTQKVSRLEQLVPYFVMEVAGRFSGLPGVFIAGVYSAGLSTLSASLNTLSAVIYEDFISPFISKDISQKRISNILKLIVLIGGVISTLCVLVFEKFGGIFPVYTALMAISAGPVLGIFTLGMLIPKANSKGAFVGAFISSIVVAWIAVQNQKYQPVIVNEFIKPLSTDGCNVTNQIVNVTSLEVDTQFDSLFILYRITFWFYSFIGLCITVIIGVTVSWFTKHDKEHVPLELLSPVIHSFVKEKVPIELANISSKANEEEETHKSLLEKK
ncbi:hypothetical protein RN001_009136 [Aquatica leii]|uniref:Sodium-dependent multivitamin transporter n=1 Tax=Aquatica leii TaxID=1421715 RepID=A0AAN7SPS3_9COLE|nr:hypothetical protein RN001_009136 [Aquatica leii]